MSSGRLFYFMRKKPVIAILANYPVWLHCDKIPVRSGHYGVWHVAMHEAFAHNDEFEIHRITLDKSVKKQVDFEHNGEFFHVLPSTRAMVGLFTGYIWNRFVVSRFLKKLKPDLVHAWGTEGCYGLCAMDFKGKKVFSVQGLLNAYSERAPMSFFERIHRHYEPRVLRSMPLITTESIWAKDRVLELAPKAKILFLDYAVEEHFFSEKRTLSGFPSCLLAGSQTPIKNVALAIEAFSRPEMQHVTLYLAGAEKEQYPNLPKNIIPLGRLNRNEMSRYLAKSWALVHTSLADTGPTVVKEARVVGLPVVVTKDCGASQYVTPQKSGFIISPSNSQELVKAVLHITKDRDTAIHMGEFEHERCRKTLSRQTMVKRVTEIYRDVLAL